MSADAAAMTPEAAAPTAEAAVSKTTRGGRRRWVLLLAAAGPVLAGGGLWFGGLLPHWLGLPDRSAPDAAAAPVLIDIPDIVTNLNTPGRRPAFLKLRAKVEAARADEAAVAAQMPRIVDLFQTLLWELRPEELRGSAGTHRLKEELLARANIAVAPARVTDVLFVEMLVQ